jgi:hypothetical protein
MASEALPCGIPQNTIPIQIMDDLKYCGIDPLIFATAIIRGDSIKIDTQYKDDLESSEAIIGRNVCTVRRLNTFFKENNIIFELDLFRASYGLHLSIKVTLADSLRDWELLTDLYSEFAPQSKEACSFYFLLLSLKGKEVTLENLVLEGYYNQCYMLPPLRKKDACYLQERTPPISLFGFKAVMSPLNSPMPSPAPFLQQQPMSSIPENADDIDSKELPENGQAEEEESDQGDFQQQKTRSRRVKLYGGTDQRPGSAPIDAVYNDEKDEGIATFQQYYTTGVNVKKYSEARIFSNYTSRVQQVHTTLKGCKTTDPAFRAFMQKRLGSFFANWEIQFPA